MLHRRSCMTSCAPSTGLAMQVTTSCLPFLHDGIGSTAFLLHESARLCGGLGHHRSLLSYEGIGNNPSVFPFLKQLCPLATTDQGEDKEDGEA